MNRWILKLNKLNQEVKAEKEAKVKIFQEVLIIKDLINMAKYSSKQRSYWLKTMDKIKRIHLISKDLIEKLMTKKKDRNSSREFIKTQIEMLS